MGTIFLVVFINDIHSRPPCWNFNLEETLLCINFLSLVLLTLPMLAWSACAATPDDWCHWWRQVWIWGDRCGMWEVGVATRFYYFIPVSSWYTLVK